MMKILYEAISHKKQTSYLINFWQWPDGKKAVFVQKEARREGDNSFVTLIRIDDMNRKDEIFKFLREKVFSVIEADNWIFLLSAKYISARLSIDNFKRSVLTTLDLF